MAWSSNVCLAFGLLCSNTAQPIVARGILLKHVGHTCMHRLIFLVLCWWVIAYLGCAPPVGVTCPTCAWGIRKISLVKLLDQWEVNSNFWKKWQVNVHWVAAGNRYVRHLMYDRNAYPGTHMMKAHSLNEILRLILLMRVNQSTDLTTKSLL